MSRHTNWHKSSIDFAWRFGTCVFWVVRFLQIRVSEMSSAFQTRTLSTQRPQMTSLNRFPSDAWWLNHFVLALGWSQSMQTLPALSFHFTSKSCSVLNVAACAESSECLFLLPSPSRPSGDQCHGRLSSAWSSCESMTWTIKWPTTNVIPHTPRTTHVFFQT